jgi:hypothetical protein
MNIQFADQEQYNNNKGAYWIVLHFYVKSLAIIEDAVHILTCSNREYFMLTFHSFH